MKLLPLPRPVLTLLIEAFFNPNITIEPADIIALYVRRWQIEVMFAETRTHLGVETQRQWTDKAIARTAPALLGF